MVNILIGVVLVELLAVAALAALVWHVRAEAAARMDEIIQRVEIATEVKLHQGNE